MWAPPQRTKRWPRACFERTEWGLGGQADCGRRHEREGDTPMTGRPRSPLSERRDHKGRGQADRPARGGGWTGGSVCRTLQGLHTEKEQQTQSQRRPREDRSAAAPPPRGRRAAQDRILPSQPGPGLGTVTLEHPPRGNMSDTRRRHRASLGGCPRHPGLVGAPGRQQDVTCRRSRWKQVTRGRGGPPYHSRTTNNVGRTTEQENRPAVTVTVTIDSDQEHGREGRSGRDE